MLLQNVLNSLAGRFRAADHYLEVCIYLILAVRFDIILIEFFYIKQIFLYKTYYPFSALACILKKRLENLKLI